MKKLAIILLLASVRFAAAAAPHVDLYCHRTANRDVPENTLESLEAANAFGCDVVEIDVRRTLDGVLVLNHDGFLERLTNGTGEVEKVTFSELKLLDFGRWMGPRFAGMHVARFDDAVRLAKRRKLKLILDIKAPGYGEAVLATLRDEGMLQSVEFGGEWNEIKALEPSAHSSTATWVSPDVTVDQVAEAHKTGKQIIANFSANSHEMDLPAMKAAVAAGVDGINVDYPRIGAEALGRSVEARIAQLETEASSGPLAVRLNAMAELGHFYGLPTRAIFLRLLLDPLAGISRAAAVQLVSLRPQPSYEVYLPALKAPLPAARASALWALGMSKAPASSIVASLRDTDPKVLQEALIALSRLDGAVVPNLLLSHLSNSHPEVRGAASLALAHHHPALAVKAITKQMQKEEGEIARQYSDYVKRGKPSLTQAEIDPIVASYRCHMKYVLALASIPGNEASKALAKEAYRKTEDFSLMNGLVAGYNLWDRAVDITDLTERASRSEDATVSDRARWVQMQSDAAHR